MNISLVITVAGPLVASVGWFLQSAWIYWFGVIVCVITMLLNMAVGAMRLPVLPIVVMTLAANYFREPWYFGAAIGLVGWTTLDAIGEVIGYFRRRE